MGWRDDDVQDAIAGLRPNSRGWIRANCPFCPERAGKEDTTRALGVNAVSGKYVCWRCGARGRLRGFDDFADEPAAASDAQHSVPLPEGFVSLHDAWASLTAAPAVGYLRSRGVGGGKAAEVGIGACFRGRYAERVVVPVYDLSGYLVNWVARSWDPRVPKADRYRYAPGGRRVLFNGKAVAYRRDVPLLVVEGVFDALPYWPNAAACLGKPSDEQVAALAEAHRPLVVALDGDAWEEGEMLATRLQLAGARATWLRLPAGRDPGNVGSRELWHAALSVDGLARRD